MQVPLKGTLFFFPLVFTYLAGNGKCTAFHGGKTIFLKTISLIQKTCALLNHKKFYKVTKKLYLLCKISYHWQLENWNIVRPYNLGHLKMPDLKMLVIFFQFKYCIKSLVQAKTFFWPYLTSSLLDITAEAQHRLPNCQYLRKALIP